MRRSGSKGVDRTRSSLASSRSTGSAKNLRAVVQGPDGTSAGGTKESNKIQVAVRTRPLNNKEKQTGDRIIWRFGPHSLEELEDDGRRSKNKTWEFENVFAPETTNDDIFAMQCKKVVDGALSGFNGTIFAYGQTASGKTFTLLGNPQESPGVTPLTMQYIFDGFAQHPEADWEVTMSYCEIYNEQVTDLLDPKKGKNLKITEDITWGPTIKDLTQVKALNAHHCMDIHDQGEKRRSYAATGMNDLSSRSHCLVRLRVERRDAGIHPGSDVETQNDMRSVAADFMRCQEDLKADNASLYFVDREHDELYIHAGDITLRLPMSQGLAGACGTTGQPINILDAYEDSRFNRDVDKRTGYRTRNILCVPCFDADGKVVGVVQFINKKQGFGDRFVNEDEASAAELARRIGPIIASAQTKATRTTTSLLNLVDLAGSERAKKTGATGILMKESQSINTSLLMLGTCISLLSEGKDQHIPFRNSKLTHLLSTSLGGNANTCIVCTISPATSNRSETVSTLQFASRAKKIINFVKQNVRRDQTTLIETLEAEIAQLKAQLASGCVTPRELGAAPTNADESSVTVGRSADVDIVLSEAFTEKFHSLDVDVAEAEGLLNTMVSSLGDGSAQVRLHPMVAISVAGARHPELSIAVSRASPNGQAPGGYELDRPEWISEDDFCAWLECLRRQSLQPSAAGGRALQNGIVVACLSSLRQDFTAKQLARFMDDAVRGVAPADIASYQNGAHLSDTLLSHRQSGMSSQQETMRWNGDISSSALTPSQARLQGEEMEPSVRGKLGHSASLLSLNQSDGIDGLTKEQREIFSLCNRVDQLHRDLGDLLGKARESLFSSSFSDDGKPSGTQVSAVDKRAANVAWQARVEKDYQKNSSALCELRVCAWELSEYSKMLAEVHRYGFRADLNRGSRSALREASPSREMVGVPYQYGDVLRHSFPHPGESAAHRSLSPVRTVVMHPGSLLWQPLAAATAGPALLRHSSPGRAGSLVAPAVLQPTLTSMPQPSSSSAASTGSASVTARNSLTPQQLRGSNGMPPRGNSYIPAVAPAVISAAKVRQPGRATMPVSSSSSAVAVQRMSVASEEALPTRHSFSHALIPPPPNAQQPAPLLTPTNAQQPAAQPQARWVGGVATP
eukprot:TRINITY_DN59188_c0_g1_i1.p1 TRINITY_DN59188_c0_g1~~TRINITY_DN59188_c0_g1_i1.p1  ORF type:complete len:1139 (-),score=223.73 TRINITY_DN59188_c0_g1_i1:209-3625(-)